jgi:putative hemolysin
MAPFPWYDLAILAGLILVNGIFSMSELAIVSARTAKLRLAAEKGSGGAKTALALAAEPGKFLATVQIGITLVAVIAGAFSGATLGGPVAERLATLGLEPNTAERVSLALVIGLTTFFTLVVGELVPKQIALRAAVPLALVMARPMALFARVAAPFVWLLDTSSSLILQALGMHHRGEHRLTAEELQMIFAEATRSGVIEEGERAMLSGIMRLGERTVRELMTPRTEVDWLDLGADETQIRETIARSPHSLLPVADGSVDKVVGVVKARQVLALLLAG